MKKLLMLRDIMKGETVTEIINLFKPEDKEKIKKDIKDMTKDKNSSMYLKKKSNLSDDKNEYNLYVTLYRNRNLKYTYYKLEYQMYNIKKPNDKIINHTILYDGDGNKLDFDEQIILNNTWHLIIKLVHI